MQYKHLWSKMMRDTFKWWLAKADGDWYPNIVVAKDKDGNYLLVWYMPETGFWQRWQYSLEHVIRLVKRDRLGYEECPTLEHLDPAELRHRPVTPVPSPLLYLD